MTRDGSIVMSVVYLTPNELSCISITYKMSKGDVILSQLALMQVISGSCWLTLATWLMLGHVGSLWVMLAPCGSCWLLVGHVGF